MELTIKEFIVVAKPNKSWNQYFSMTNDDTFETNHKYIDKIRKSKYIEVLHPRKTSVELHSFEILKKGDIFFVHNINQTGYFKRTDGTNIIFFYDENEIERDIFAIVFGENHNNSQQYKMIEPEFWSFNNESRAFKNSLMAKRFFHSITNTSDADKRRVVETIETKDDIETNYSTAGWLNPIILKVKLEGNEIDPSIKKSFNDTSIEQILSYIVEKESIIFIEPVLSENFETRIKFFEKVWLNIQHRNEKIQKSLVEYLILSDNYILNNNLSIQAWKPFMVLDSLKGIFFIKGFGENVIISWITDDSGLTNNKKFFIDYWAKYWNGNVNISFFNKTKANNNSQDNTYKTLLSFDNKEYEILSFPAYEKKGKDINEFSNLRYYAPKSSIFIEISPCIFRPAKKINPLDESISDTCIDLIHTPFKGATYFVENLLSDNEQFLMNRTKSKSIYFEFSWWKFWFQSIYQDTYDIIIHLFPYNWFIIGSGELDKTPLGKKETLYKQTPYIGF